ncbi:MAG: hypothetical protein ACFFF4_04800 [Candidatus Thorarchaeota archaeon]
MSVAKKAVDSTIRKILVYTAEIIASIILLVIICLPLVFTVPMWIQRVALGTPVADLWVNPVAWFGLFGAFAATILLAIVSVIIGYPYVMKLIPGAPKSDDSDTIEDEEVVEAMEEEIEEAELIEEAEEAEGIEESETEEDVEDSEEDDEESED